MDVERVVRKVLVRHLEGNGVFPDGQHGSRSQRSTLTQLLVHHDSVLDDLESSSEGIHKVTIWYGTRWCRLLGEFCVLFF